MPYDSRLLLVYHGYALNVPFDRKVILIREIGDSREGSPPPPKCRGGKPFLCNLIRSGSDCDLLQHNTLLRSHNSVNIQHDHQTVLKLSDALNNWASTKTDWGGGSMHSPLSVTTSCTALTMSPTVCPAISVTIIRVSSFCS